MENKKNYVDGIDVSACEHYRAEIETKMPYGEYEIQKDKCHYSDIEVIQNCKGNKGCIYKQLQRLKEENVKLLFGKGTLVEFCNKLTQIIDEKKESENKLLQTLQEIKELADNQKTTADYTINKIIEKINEVIGAE